MQLQQDNPWKSKQISITVLKNKVSKIIADNQLGNCII